MEGPVFKGHGLAEAVQRFSEALNPPPRPDTSLVCGTTRVEELLRLRTAHEQLGERLRRIGLEEVADEVSASA